MTVNVLSAIDSVPTRLGPKVFVATMNETFPVPAPGPALTTATHETLLTASQAHAAGAVTVVLPNPPSAVNAWLVDSIENVHALGAACVTVKVLPAIVIVPVRVVVPVYAATVNVALPDPLPLEPAIMVIHGALLLAVHAQPAPALTVLLPVPPWLLNVWLVGDVEYEQAAPACVTLNVVPAIVSVPLRLVVDVFAATEKPALPAPEPVAPLVTVIQVALLVVLHVQPEAAVTEVPPEPPAAPKDWLVDEMLYEQLAFACVTVNVAPAIVSVPLRLVMAVLAATVKLVLPGPDPEAPLVTVIHDALLLAVHAQPAPAVTALELVPPAAVNDWFAGEML